MVENIAEGYKQSDVGVIPKDWEYVEFGQYLKIRHGKSQHDVEDSNGEYPIMATGGLIGYANAFLYDKPSVLIGRKGTIDVPQYIDKPFWTIDTLFFSEISKQADVKYIYYLFQTIDWYKYNEASGVPSLSAKIIEQIKKPVPPISEQKAIANALSDIDNLISSIEKLIYKKKNIKQGAMEELLTGKKRLDGFSGEWVYSVIKEIADICRGASPRPIDDEKWFDNDSTIGWVRISDVTSSKKYLFSTVQKLSKQGITKSRFVGRDNLIMSICATVGRAILTKIDVCIHDGFVVFQNLKIEKDYMYYVLEQKESLWAKYGQTGSQMNLNTSIINNEQIFYTVDTKEQAAIAQILSDMDTEIEKLNQKLTKYKEIKQGMMQEILTGRRRLV